MNDNPCDEWWNRSTRNLWITGIGIGLYVLFMLSYIIWFFFFVLGTDG